jgi:hypothetical protein
MEWRCGSSGRAPALQTQSSDSNPSSTTKKKKTNPIPLVSHYLFLRINHLFIYCIYFWRYFNFELGLTTARQALYHLSHSGSPFLCCVFSGWGSLKLFVMLGFELPSS